jgi:hypothetical protein
MGNIASVLERGKEKKKKPKVALQGPATGVWMVGT